MTTASPGHADTTGSRAAAAGEADAVRLPDLQPAPRVRQARALAGSEWLLLRRNKVALLNTVLAPGLLVGLFSLVPTTPGLGLGRRCRCSFSG